MKEVTLPMDDHDILIRGIRKSLQDCIDILTRTQRVAAKSPLPPAVNVINPDDLIVLKNNLTSSLEYLNRLEVDIDEIFEDEES